MQVERFRIRGFKSIADVELDGLSAVNVFCGLNDTGRSNIFQALSLWGWLLSRESSPEGQLSLLPPERLVPWERLEQTFGLPLFRLGGDNTIQLEVDVAIDRSDLQELNPVISEASREIISLLGPASDTASKIQIASESELTLHPKGVLCQTRNQAYAGDVRFDVSQNALSSLLMRFHVIPAIRRFRPEKQKTQERIERVNDHNLKQALLDADLSHRAVQKRQLGLLKRTLSDPPFNLGELDVTLDPATDRVDIGFVRSNGWLPLENMGAGAQQILMVLGQILLNDCPIVAIEEPETNLSAQYQQHLLLVLRRFIEDSRVRLSQLFVSTHSPYFECEDSFFDVTLDEEGSTHVICLPASGHNRYFPGTSLGPEAGPRLNALNQITLSESIVKDLGLQYGDLVVITKNMAGRWELRTEDKQQ